MLSPMTTKMRRRPANASAVAHSCSTKDSAARTRSAALLSRHSSLSKLRLRKRPAEIPRSLASCFMSPSWATRIAPLASAAVHTTVSADPVAMPLSRKKITSWPAACSVRPTESATPSSRKNLNTTRGCVTRPCGWASIPEPCRYRPAPETGIRPRSARPYTHPR